MIREAASLSPKTSRAVAAVLGLWFLIAFGVGASGLYYGVPAPVVGASNATLVVLTLIAVFTIDPLRQWVAALPLRWLVLFHVTRFVGFAFLALHASGALPDDFALAAGWGDIAVAAGALAVGFAACPVTSRGRWWAVLVWNVFGLLDILAVLSTALRLGLADPAQVVVISSFPMSLLPTFLVPLVIVTHILIFVRLWATRARPHAPKAA